MRSHARPSTGAVLGPGFCAPPAPSGSLGARRLAPAERPSLPPPPRAGQERLRRAQAGEVRAEGSPSEPRPGRGLPGGVQTGGRLSWAGRDPPSYQAPQGRADGLPSVGLALQPPLPAQGGGRGLLLLLPPRNSSQPGCASPRFRLRIRHLPATARLCAALRSEAFAPPAGQRGWGSFEGATCPCWGCCCCCAGSALVSPCGVLADRPSGGWGEAGLQPGASRVPVRGRGSPGVLTA